MIDYYLLTKPGIIFGNLVTFAAGFLLASHGSTDAKLFLLTLFGLALIMASACVFNNYIDRPLDAKMKRTQNRALVTGSISGRHALLFASVLGIAGSLVLFWFANLLALAVAWVGFFVYVVLYSFWKSHTIYGTAIGSIAGAVPPVVGYCAVSNQLDAGALILFAMLVCWQMPHFFAIALFHLEDYTRAGIPVLPIVKGAWRAKVHMAVYIIGFVASAGLLFTFGYAGAAYLMIITCLGLAWLALCLKGFYTINNQTWGYHMYRLSLLVITIACLMIPLDSK